MTTSPRFLRRIQNRPVLRRRSSVAVLWRLLLVASGLGIGGLAGWGGYEWLHRTPLFELRHLDLQTVPAELREEVRARIAEVAAGNLLLVDLQLVQRRLESIPQVRAARVRRQLPDTLDVRVDTRRPWGVLEADDGALLVARDGVVLGPAATGARLPRVRLAAALQAGISPDGRPDAAAPGIAFLQDAVRIVDWLTERPLAFGAVGSVRLEPGGVVLLLEEPAWELMVGDAEDLEVKAENLLALTAREPPAGPSAIDLRYRDMVVVRALPAPPAGTGRE